MAKIFPQIQKIDISNISNLQMPKITIDDEVIKELEEKGAILKNKLVKNRLYIGFCRNSTLGKWDGSKFEYLRYKYGTLIIDYINHFQDDNSFDVFVPIREVIFE